MSSVVGVEPAQACPHAFIMSALVSAAPAFVLLDSTTYVALTTQKASTIAPQSCPNL
jgi:hypothetical protein